MSHPTSNIPSSYPTATAPTTNFPPTMHRQVERSSPPHLPVSAHVHVPRPQRPTRESAVRYCPIPPHSQPPVANHPPSFPSLPLNQNPSIRQTRPPPLQTNPLPNPVHNTNTANGNTTTTTLKNFLDVAFRTYADRIHTELATLRALCARAVWRERQDTERWKTHCVAFMRERDIERERVRVLMERGVIDDESGGRGIKRGRSDEDGDTGEAEDDAVYPSNKSSPSPMPRFGAFMKPISAPATPTRTPTRSPNPIPLRDATSFDLTILNTTGERIENHQSEQPTGKRRKRGGSSAAASDTSSQTCVSVADSRSLEKEVESWFNEREERNTDGLGEGDMELESEVDASECKSTSPSLATDAVVDPATVTPPSKSPLLLPPLAINIMRKQEKGNEEIEPERVHIELTHVDLMYVPVGGKLTCRACLLCPTLAGKSKSIPQSFPTNASWALLRDHCVREHPVACRDVARLHPAEVYELRRRLAGVV